MVIPAPSASTAVFAFLARTMFTSPNSMVLEFTVVVFPLTVKFPVIVAFPSTVILADVISLEKRLFPTVTSESNLTLGVNAISELSTLSIEFVKILK